MFYTVTKIISSSQGVSINICQIGNQQAFKAVLKNIKM
jgi:hypothetical protein